MFVTSTLILLGKMDILRRIPSFLTIISARHNLRYRHIGQWAGDPAYIMSLHSSFRNPDFEVCLRIMGTPRSFSIPELDRATHGSQLCDRYSIQRGFSGSTGLPNGSYSIPLT